MAEKVYSFDISDMGKLSRALSYDPYLDKNLLPEMPKEFEDKKYMEQHPELKQKKEELEKTISDAKNRLNNDKNLKVIFARQEYDLRDGSSLGLDSSKCYLYLKANEEFLKNAEDRLEGEYKSFAKADEETSQKVIRKIHEEEDRANTGFGSIFG